MVNLDAFIKMREVAFISSVDENGYPNIKAMLRPRKIIGLKEFYFSTNTSSLRVAQYEKNNKASVYFYKKGKFKYIGVMFIGEIEVLSDKDIKKELWRAGDFIYYRKGVDDPDYCVLKFTAHSARYYCNLKTETINLEE